MMAENKADWSISMSVKHQKRMTRCLIILSTALTFIRLLTQGKDFPKSDSGRPTIAKFVHLERFHDLRSHPTLRPEAKSQVHFVLLQDVSLAKVGDLGGQVVAQEDVASGQISVNHSMAGQKGHAMANLRKSVWSKMSSEVSGAILPVNTTLSTMQDCASDQADSGVPPRSCSDAWSGSF